MAATIETALGVSSELIPKGRGIFDVEVDGRLVYSKFETGVFPDNEQLVAKLLPNHGKLAN
ncbi:SelT/SelW/SelH family protein [Halieaceae bacterium IMCC14734]|uniref:SelT/SelW/SelH family protein n=1 Tax=Candidatus Litorirhabdus singularis TaxID=2518993 RepID=A0ABT3TIH9_9GAMM|nr:SelT/SelW/SelH family protein [Candidatus Litorirhabdus singularis]